MSASKHNLLLSCDNKNLPYGQIAKASGLALSYVCLLVTKLQTAIYLWNMPYYAKLGDKRTKQPHF